MSGNNLKKEAYDSYLRKVGNDEEKKRKLKDKYESSSSVQEFTLYANTELGLGCPDGWKACTDNSCVPVGDACP